MELKNFKTLCDCIRLYQSRGYKVQKIFKNEYILMLSDDKKIRLYFNGNAFEYV